MGRNALGQKELFNDCESIDTSKSLKTCVKCKKVKPITSFRDDAFKSRVCKDCCKKRDKQARKLKLVTPPPSKDYKCPICLTDAKKHEGVNNQWCLDHDHNTEKFRGWLCNKCNAGLGYFSDNINYIKRAVQYLEKSNGNS